VRPDGAGRNRPLPSSVFLSTQKKRIPPSLPDRPTVMSIAKRPPSVRRRRRPEGERPANGVRPSFGLGKAVELRLYEGHHVASLRRDPTPFDTLALEARDRRGCRGGVAASAREAPACDVGSAPRRLPAARATRSGQHHGESPWNQAFKAAAIRVGKVDACVGTRHNVLNLAGKIDVYEELVGWRKS
jgi:hypothetical protein